MEDQRNYEDLLKDVMALENDIRAQKLKLRAEKQLLKLAEYQRARERVGQGTHTGHAKGSDHHFAKPWNVWEMVDRQNNEYRFVGVFGSIGEIAKTYNKDYYSVWQMKRRWETKVSATGRPVKVLLRIEPAH